MVNMWISGACFMGGIERLIFGDVWTGVAGMFFFGLNLYFGLKEKK